MPNIDRYAYEAEAALAQFADAHEMRQEPLNRERHACALFARAARNALAALCTHAGLPCETTALNLMAPVARLGRSPFNFGRTTDSAYAHARWLSRVLILDQQDAGPDYVTRDLFDVDDVRRSEAASVFFIDRCCQHLLRTDWEQALIRFLPFREVPMTNTILWQRRSRGRPYKRSQK